MTLHAANTKRKIGAKWHLTYLEFAMELRTKYRGNGYVANIPLLASNVRSMQMPCEIDLRVDTAM